MRILTQRWRLGSLLLVLTVAVTACEPITQAPITEDVELEPPTPRPSSG